MAKNVEGTIYLLHFDKPYKHARHYIGWTSDLDKRLADHASGNGSNLMAVIHAAGIGFVVARTWPGTRKREKTLKHWPGGSKRLCPICESVRQAGASIIDAEKEDGNGISGPNRTA